MPGKIHIGIGGWTYAPWRGVFYPKGLPQKRELEFASRHLTSIEINGTYYSTFKPASWAKWRDETPDGFVFSVKASRFCTNRRELASAGESIDPLRRPGARRAGGPARADQLAVHGHQEIRSPRISRRSSKLLPREVDGLPLRHALEVRHASFKDKRFYRPRAQA